MLAENTLLKTLVISFCSSLGSTLLLIEKATIDPIYLWATKWRHNPPRNDAPPREHNPPRDDNNAQALVDQARARREAELAAQLGAHQRSLVHPLATIAAGMTYMTVGVPCLVPALRNERLPKDFKGPREVPNCTADLPPEAWIESY